MDKAANDKKITPASDLEYIEALIRENGYKMAAAMMYVRLVANLNYIPERLTQG